MADTRRGSVETTSEDRKFKGEAVEWGTRQGQRANGVVRSSAGDMLGMEGNDRGGKRDAQKDRSQTRGQQ